MAYQAAVITVSDKGSTGERVDTSGPAVRAMLEGAGYQVIHTAIVPDDKLQIGRELTRCADELGCDLVLTTGGTGLSPRDVTPEATRAVLHREIPAIPQAMLSRATAGTRGSCLIINLPGSEKAARENLGAVLDTLDHALKMMAGGGH